MLRKIRKSVFAAAVGMAPFAAGSALAEDTTRPDERESDGTSENERGTRRAWTGEVVRVTAKGTAADVPDALAIEFVDFEHAVAAPADFQDLVTQLPGVGATGQNGLFETFSIRGSGANGILILVGGIPITAQRRAGVPVAFVEPSLLGDVAATLGPAVVHYGPGALGGAVSIEPRWFDAPFANASYATGGDEALLAAGLGSDSYSIAAARHQAGDSEAANGAPLNTSYERESALLQYRGSAGAFDVDAFLLPSRTENIGKSNSRYPARDSTYPEDSHTLGRVRLRHAGGLEASVFAHDQYLGTWNRRPGSPDTFAGVSSTDYGATLQQTFETGAIDTNIGFDYFGRRNVDAYDASASVLDRDYTLRGARENDYSLFAIADWRVAPALALEFGGRWTATSQDHRGDDSNDSDGALTAGAVWKPTAATRVTLNAAGGYRFPTLEERFYTGVTPQGEVVGNPNLSSEHSRGVDLGYAWHPGAWGFEAHAWRNEVRDLIQLTPIAEGIDGYDNLGKGTLYGAEAIVGFAPNERFSLLGSVALVRGHDQTGAPLYGIPPVTSAIEAHYTFGDFTLGGRYSHRAAMDRPGFEEVERDSVELADFDLRWNVSRSWRLQLFVRNLFDEDYYATADELSSFGPERSVGVSASWTMH
ncbi:MAG TPA: TonB-dependent receptor [Rhodanobacteraceae bacterium]|nr:TonB-dependent receptor [Rhodanobacteraceae bacterium]